MSSVLRFQTPELTKFSPRVLSTLIAVLALMVIGFTTACGSGGSTSHALTGNTQVTLALTSTANDQLSEFDIGFLGITLTSQSGKTATLLPTSAAGAGPGAEFIEMNGPAEPLVSATIPQDVYTSATVSLNAAEFTCIELVSDNGQEDLAGSTYDSNGVSASDVTVTLPEPITVTGATMGLSLNLQVAQSVTYSACFTPNGFSTWSITPTFTLTPFNLSSSPTNASNGKVSGLNGQVTATGTNSDGFTVSLPDSMGARSVSVTSNSATVYQGIGSYSTLAVGTFVNIDGALQPDSSLVATRVAVEDPSAGDILSGPALMVLPPVGKVLMQLRQEQGQDFACCYLNGALNIDFGSATFQTSGQMTNLGSLPFVPSFNELNMVPGQSIYITVASFSWDSSLPTASTITLMPQTINGTVAASSVSGNFTDYTVTLAPYDLFPMLAGQPDQTAVENNPSQVEVYVDSNTQLLNTQPLATGNTLRFYGLVFNDNGTLRMDCAQVNDGVTASSQSNDRQHMNTGQINTVRQQKLGHVLVRDTTSVINNPQR